MNNKDTIIEATITLINEKQDHMEEITMREISKRAGVGLGLINYYFENKENLFEICVEKIVNGIVAQFLTIGEQTKGYTPFEKLNFLGNMTLTFLFEHEAVSRISILSDTRYPKEDDNTTRTLKAYLPLVSACRPDWNEEKVQQMTFYLISCMQFAFLRHDIILKTQGINLKNEKQRKEFHYKMLKNILDNEGGFVL